VEKNWLRRNWRSIRRLAFSGSKDALIANKKDQLAPKLGKS